MAPLTPTEAASTFYACIENVTDLLGRETDDATIDAEALKMFRGVADEYGWDVETAVAMVSEKPALPDEDDVARA